MPPIKLLLDTPKGRFAVVAAQFNVEVVDRLVEGAMAELHKHGVREADIDLVRVPGAFELPLACQKLASTGRYAAVIALGAVIRGDTDHYDYVCRGATDGLMRVSLDTGVPISFGVLTCQTDELAMERAGGKHGNKGADAAQAAIEMANLMAKLQ
jgi:6,7-dimethyl-8-ribityllumazine synthase